MTCTIYILTSYILYKDLFHYHSTKIRRKTPPFKYNKEECACDFFCKLMIQIFANYTKKFDTPKSLYNKLIFSGEYTSWKGFFLESPLAEMFGVRRKKYKIEGLEELLENTITCALILYDCIEKIKADYEQEEGDDERSINEDIWWITKKLIDNNIKFLPQWEQDSTSNKDKLKFEIVQVNSGLDVDEQDMVAIFLLGRRLHRKDIPAYLETRRSSKNNLEQTLSQEEKKILRNQLEYIYNEYERSENIVIQKNKKGDRENSDNRQIKFSTYLAPIMAAICEYHNRIPFFIKTNIWKKEETVKYLLINNIDETYSQKLFGYYTELKKFCNYENELRCISEKDDILQKYEEMCYQFIYKTSLIKGIYAENKYIVYYLIEKITGLMLVEKVTDSIYKHFTETSPNQAVEKFLADYKLQSILKKIYSMDGVISKIELVKSVLEIYLKKRRSKSKLDKVMSEIEEQIEASKLYFALMERFFLDEISADEWSYNEKKMIELSFEGNYKFIKDLKCMKVSSFFGDVNKSYEELVEQNFQEYFKREKELKELKGSKGSIRPSKIEEFVKVKLANDNKYADENRKRIKRWVISNCVLDDVWVNFEISTKKNNN